VSPADCRIQVKTNSITITLKKEDKKHWIDLTKKSGAEGSAANKKGPADERSLGADSSDDPTSSLM